MFPQSVFLVFATQFFITCQYVITLAGSNAARLQDGQGNGAFFNNPWIIQFDQFGNLFIVDNANHAIRRMNTSGYVSTWAGTGYPGYNDGPRLQAQFNNPMGVFVDNSTNLYVTDNHNQRIRKIGLDDNVITIAGRGTASYSDGQGTNASFHYPYGILVDSLGNIIVADQHNHCIRMINSTNYVSTIFGRTNDGYMDGQGQSAQFYYPTGMTKDSIGNIFIADQFNNLIRKVNTTGYVSTFVGSGANAFFDGQGISAAFKYPLGVAIDLNDNIFVADTYNHRIRRINATGYVSTIAGNGVQSFKDGQALRAEFNAPGGLAVDSMGNIFVADTYNNRIRKIDMNYTATTTSFVSSTLASSASPSAVIVTPFVVTSPDTDSTTITMIIYHSTSASSLNTNRLVNQTIAIYLKSEFYYSLIVGFFVILIIIWLLNAMSQIKIGRKENQKRRNFVKRLQNMEQQRRAYINQVEKSKNLHHPPQLIQALKSLTQRFGLSK